MEEDVSEEEYQQQQQQRTKAETTESPKPRAPPKKRDPARKAAGTDVIPTPDFSKGLDAHVYRPRCPLPLSRLCGTCDM